MVGGWQCRERHEVGDADRVCPACGGDVFWREGAAPRARRSTGAPLAWAWIGAGVAVQLVAVVLLVRAWDHDSLTQAVLAAGRGLLGQALLLVGGVGEGIEQGRDLAARERAEEQSAGEGRRPGPGRPAPKPIRSRSVVARRVMP